MIMAVILQVILIFAVFVTCSEQAALRLLGEQDLADAEKADAGKIRKLQEMKKTYGGFDQAARTMLVFLTLCAGAGAVAGFAIPISEKLSGSIAWLPEWGAVVLGTVLIVCVLLLLHGAAANRLASGRAVKDALGSALAVCTPAYALFIVLTPLIRVNAALGNLVIRAIGVEPEMEAAAMEDGIRLMAESGSLRGAIDSQENEFIQNVFEFNDVPVEEICTHRTDVICLYEDETDEEWEKTVFENRHSYFVICGEDTDDVVGVLDAKTYIRMPQRDRETVRSRCVLKPYLVPESMKAATLFANMKKTGNFFAVAIDEYGGMAGIVTMRDLLELIVGEWTEKDEEKEPEEIEKTGENTWKIRGVAPLEEVARALEISLPTEDYDTFGGFVFGELGYVPEDGSTVELTAEGLDIFVKRIEDHRIEEAAVTKRPEETEENS